MELRRRKQQSMERARSSMKNLEKSWNDQKELIQFNVANKPLLVE